MDTNTDNKLRLFTRGQGKRLKLRGLRRRWLASSVGPIIVILVLVGVLSAATISSSLDARARSSLEAKAKSGSDYFSAYSMGSYSEYYRRAAQYVTDYSLNDSLAKNVELQFINGKRQVELSSRGAVAGSTPATPEVGRAVETGKTASFAGRDPLTGENILAVSSPVFYNGAVVAVMRFVTSTRLLDQQLWLTVLVMAAVIAAVIFLIFVSNLIFINNVVQPVAEVSEAAKRISSGSYGIQIANKYTDELGQLVDNINNMSLKISQSEKMQTEFISSVSHELRTPLTAISGWGETLLGDETGDPRQPRRGLRIIVKEARRLTGMVEELLEFSRIEAGRFNLSVEPLDIVAELEKPGRDPRDSAPEAEKSVTSEPKQAAPVVSSADKTPQEAGKLAHARPRKGAHAPALPEMQERVCTVLARTANDQRVPEVRRENPAGRAGTVRVHLPSLQENELRPDEHRGCRNHKPEILLRLRPEHPEAHVEPGQALLYDVRRAG